MGSSEMGSSQMGSSEMGSSEFSASQAGGLPGDSSSEFDLGPQGATTGAAPAGSEDFSLSQEIPPTGEIQGSSEFDAGSEAAAADESSAHKAAVEGHQEGSGKGREETEDAASACSGWSADGYSAVTGPAGVQSADAPAALALYRAAAAMSRILLADDSPHAQRMGERILRDEGHEVITVSDGRVALLRLADASPDVIIADISMPEVSGYELCEYVKSHGGEPVLLTAGAVEPVDEKDVERVKADGLLKKPFEATASHITISLTFQIGRYSFNYIGCQASGCRRLE